MRVVIAPDSFGGTLDPVEAAEALASGWRHVRPDDDVVLRPMSDGGEGLLKAIEWAVADQGRPAKRVTVEVADARGLATDADFLVLDGGEIAIIEAAQACGLARVPADRRNPRLTTTWGVGQLLTAVAATGVRRVLVGVGGTATVDGGAGALSGLGFRVTVADGSGLKVGGEDLHRVTGIAPGWVDPAVLDLEVLILADVEARLAEAAPLYGPQKGADPSTVDHLARGLAAWADVVESSFDAGWLRDKTGSGAAGGLGFALAAALGAPMISGARAVGALIGLDVAMEGADVVLTGEGRIDRTSFTGKVISEVLHLAGPTPVGAVSGGPCTDEGALTAVEVASRNGPGDNPARAVADAAARLAQAKA